VRALGLHVRVNGSLDEVRAQVEMLGINALQMFVRHEASHMLIKPSQAMCQRFMNFVQQNMTRAYIHASYLINPARDVPLREHYVFKREVELAQRLGIHAIVVHPGSAHDMHVGIDALARFINQCAQKYPTMQLIFENVAFKEPSLGGSFENFGLLLNKIDTPDTVMFCVDTAHAHAYGYDVTTPHGQEQLLASITRSIGLERIALLHINDTVEHRGACMDKHAFIGQGTIGKDALRNFVLDQRLANIPMIAEIPACTLEEQRRCVQELYAWHHDGRRES
jgi:deoxyribonuclease-4